MASNVKASKQDAPPPPLCVYCKAPWTNEQVCVGVTIEMKVGYSGEKYSTNNGRADIDIYCSSCERLVYRRAVETTDIALESQFDLWS